MKILVVGPYKSPIIERLVLALKSRNHEVYLASHNAGNNNEIINLGALENILDFFKVIKIQRLINKIQPDVVHAHVLNHYGLMASLQTRPLVVALWGSDVMLSPNTGPYIKRMIFKLINALVLRRANICHTSADHVAMEAASQYSGAIYKTKIFYWGLPLKKPNKKQSLRLTEKLDREFKITLGRKYIVFPRGLDEIYSPEIVIKIIKKLIFEIPNSKDIVVLKGFCKNENEAKFRNNFNVELITFVDRILSSEELHILYSNTVAHISIPISDSLGAGVVEPAILGSFPILSMLPSYQAFAENTPAHLMKDYSDAEIDKVVDILINKYNNNIKIKSDYYSEDSVIEKIEKMYQEAIIKAKKQ